MTEPDAATGGLPWSERIAEPEPHSIKDAYGRFPSGIVCVAAMIDERPVGLVASSFTTVSWDPPLVSFCIQNSSKTWPTLRSAPGVGVSVLSDTHRDVTRQMASSSTERFAGIDVHASAKGAVLLDHAAAWLECTLESEVPAGDHHIVILRVTTIGSGAGSPLVYHRASIRQLATD